MKILLTQDGPYSSVSAPNHDLKKRLQRAQQDEILHFYDLEVPAVSHKKVLLEKLGKSIYEKCHVISKNMERLVIVHDCLMITYKGDLHSIPNFKCYFFPLYFVFR